MDYIDIQSIVNDELHRRINDMFPRKHCPKCDIYSPMVKITNYDDEEHPLIKLRCLSCLSVFTEQLVSYKEKNKKINHDKT